MTDYGSFVPEALKTSQNPTLAILGERLFLDTDVKAVEPLKFLIGKTLEGTHTAIVTVDYLIYTQHKSGVTHSTYIMEDKVSFVLPKNIVKGCAD